jgi:hypothetical protein
MNAPPRISSATNSSVDRSPAWAFMGVLVLLAGARVSLAWPLPLPFCLLKRLTGIPCPFCGATRCLQSCSRFDFASAFFWNPLALAAGAGVALWFMAWAVDRLWNLGWLAGLRRAFQIRGLKFVLIGAVFLNWAYLCFALR